MKREHTLRAFVYLTLGLAMLFFALPKLPSVTLSLTGAYTICWLLFAMLFIGANLYYLIGADRDHQARKRRNAILQWKLRQYENQSAYQKARRPRQAENKRRFMN